MENLIHFCPSVDTYNVRCLNGSAHARRTENIKEVTCPLCLDKNTNSDFWFYKNGTPVNFKQNSYTKEQEEMMMSEEENKKRIMEDFHRIGNEDRI